MKNKPSCSCRTGYLPRPKRLTNEVIVIVIETLGTGLENPVPLGPNISRVGVHLFAIQPAMLC